MGGKTRSEKETHESKKDLEICKVVREESKVEQVGGGEGAVSLYPIYLLYKANVISRDVLRRVLQEVKKSVPADLVAFLVEESQK